MIYPHVLQQGEKDCGCAAICTLLLSSGIHLSTAKFNSQFYDGVVGMTIGKMITILKEFNLRPRVFEINKSAVKTKKLIKQFSRFSTPLIALVKMDTGNHFVVVEKIKRDSLVISDPDSIFIRKEKIDLFLKHLLVLICVDTENPTVDEKLLETKDTVVGTLLKAGKGPLSLILIFSVVLTFLSIISSFYFGTVINLSIQVRRFNMLLSLTFIFGVVAIFQILLGYIKDLVSVKLGIRYQYRISKVFLKKVLNSRFEDFSKYPVGQYISRLNDSITAISLFTQTGINIIINLLYIIISLMVVFVINKNLFVLSLIIIGALFVNIVFFFFRLYELNREVMRNESAFTSSLIQMFENLFGIKCFSLQKKIKSFCVHLLEKLVRKTERLGLVTVLSSSLQQLIVVVGNVALVFIGSEAVLQNRVSIGDITIVFGVMSFLINSANSFYLQQANFQQLLVSMSRLKFVLEFPEEHNQGIEESEVKEISLSNFTLFSHEKILFRNQNFKFEFSGAPTVIRGESGVGKSLLFKTLLGFFDDYEGTISINNHKLNEINILNLRKQILYVSNNEKLFEGTIRENLDVDHTLNDDQLKHVCETCGLDTIINAFPLKFNQYVNPNESPLSVGQIQRIAIIRAVLKRPQVIVFDESLSNIDKENLGIVTKWLESHNDIYIIYITHTDLPIQHAKIIEFKSKSIRKMKSGEIR